MNGHEPTAGDEATRQALSALMDGDADDGVVARACAAWRGDAQARADWHAYHVIGDVLRTAEQGPSLRGDAAFVDLLRHRLEREPVVVAPTPAVQRPAAAVEPQVAVAGRRSAWRAPLAAAAGVAAVAGVVFTMRPGLPDAQAPLLAQAPAQAASAAARVAVPRAVSPTPAEPVLAGVQRTEPVVVVRDPRMLRDERLDRYLDAHRQFSEGAWSVRPAATVRGVSTLAPER